MKFIALLVAAVAATSAPKHANVENNYVSVAEAQAAVEKAKAEMDEAYKAYTAAEAHQKSEYGRLIDAKNKLIDYKNEIAEGDEKLSGDRHEVAVEIGDMDTEWNDYTQTYPSEKALTKFKNGGK